MKNRFLIIFLAALLAAALSACGPDKTDDNMTNDEDKNLEPDIAGEVLEVQNENTLRVLVDSKSDYAAGQIWVSVTDGTKFVDSQGLEIEPEDIESLFVVGEDAAFLSDGMILESYPMQTKAEVVFVE